MTDSTNWEISIIEFENDVGKKYKVSRRLPTYAISETKIFRSKNTAKQRLDEWMAESYPFSAQVSP